MSTDTGVTREVPILPFDVASASVLVRGMIVEWDSGTQRCRPWTSGAVPAFGVCTGDADNRVLLVDVFVGKGCSVMIQCAPGIVPNPNDYLYWSAPGICSNNSDGHPPFARAIGVGMNSMVESIII